jgi:hypothetical protein
MSERLISEWIQIDTDETIFYTWRAKIRFFERVLQAWIRPGIAWAIPGERWTRKKEEPETREVDV